MKNITYRNIEDELESFPCFNFLVGKGNNVDRVFGKIYSEIKSQDGKPFTKSASKLGKTLGITRWTVYRALDVLTELKVIVALGGDLGYEVNYSRVTELSVGFRKNQKQKKSGLDNLVE